MASACAGRGRSGAIPGALSTSAERSAGELSVIRSYHRRLTFTQDIQRIAIGNTDILSAELLTSRELLVLGRETGRTTLIVWFTNGASLDYIFSVQRDLSVLERALERVHPSIDVEIAPDRDAIVLTGLVPDLVVSQTAEAVARNYLDAGGNARSAAQPFIAAPPAAAPDAAIPRLFREPHLRTPRSKRRSRSRVRRFSFRAPCSRRGASSI